MSATSRRRKSCIWFLFVVVSVCLLLVASGSALAASFEVVDLFAYSPAAQPLLPTGVVSAQPTDPSFSRDVRMAMSCYQVVYAFATPDALAKAAGDIGVSADVPNAQASAIVRDMNGRFGLVTLTSNITLTASQAVEGLTALVNRSKTGQSLTSPSLPSALTGYPAVAAGSYMTYAGYFGWGVRAYEPSGAWIGDTQVYSYEYYMVNDNDPSRDYWISNVEASMDPGYNMHGSTWQSYQLSIEFLKRGSVTRIANPKPASTIPASQYSYSYTIGWPPSASLGFSFKKPNITIRNWSSPPNYAWWVFDWQQNTPGSKTFSQVSPAYTAEVTQGGNFTGRLFPQCAHYKKGSTIFYGNYSSINFTVNKP